MSNRTMTGRQRVLRALEFDRPDRVPRHLWVLPVAELQHGKEALDAFFRRWPLDIVEAPAPNAAARDALCSGQRFAIGTFRDEWGCSFENIQAGVHGEVKHPLLEDWSQLDQVKLPAVLLDVDREAVNRFCRQSERFILAGTCPRPFERMQFYRGSENLYLDLADPPDSPPEFFTLLNMLHGFFCRELEAWARTDVDGLSFMDDWGSQRALLISPAQWRRIFKPLYAQYVQIIHAAGKKAFMHSDGYIFDIYADLVEIGVDAVNSQLFCMDIEEIGRRFAGRITFWGEIDRQHILPFGTEEEARAAVRRVARNLSPGCAPGFGAGNWGTSGGRGASGPLSLRERVPPSLAAGEGVPPGPSGGGGVIAHFELSAGAKLTNADAIFDEWERVGRVGDGGA